MSLIWREQPGLVEYLEANGIYVEGRADGTFVSNDDVRAQALIDSYVPSPVLDLPESVAAWAAKAILEDADMLSTVEAACISKGPIAKWRFREATRWMLADIQDMLSEVPNISEEQAIALYSQAALAERGEA